MTRTDILNRLAKVHGYNTYLEIGVANGANLRSVQIPYKVGVDPAATVPIKYPMTSDEFFEKHSHGFDLIFIDGLHEFQQVNRDIENALLWLSENGTIVVHDCNPDTECMQIVPRPETLSVWTGDVWKSIVRLRMQRPDLAVCVVDTDWGCGIIRRGQQTLIRSFPIEELTFQHLEDNRVELLNLVSEIEWISSNPILRSDRRVKAVRRILH